MVDIDELEEKECACDTCQNMCTNFSCWGTPEQMRLLIEEEGGDKFYCVSYYSYPENIYILAPKPESYNPDRRRKTSPKYGNCIFFTKGRLCSLHHKEKDGVKLKPLEGRLVDHNSRIGVDDPHDAIAKMWDSEEGRELVLEWLNGEI